MVLEVEEDFDPRALGFDVAEPAANGSTQGIDLQDTAGQCSRPGLKTIGSGTSVRAFSGGYSSADWTPNIAINGIGTDAEEDQVEVKMVVPAHKPNRHGGSGARERRKQRREASRLQESLEDHSGAGDRVLVQDFGKDGGTTSQQDGDLNGETWSSVELADRNVQVEDTQFQNGDRSAETESAMTGDSNRAIDIPLQVDTPKESAFNVQALLEAIVATASGSEEPAVPIIASTAPPRNFKIRFTRRSLPGNPRRSRPAIRVVRRGIPSPPIEETDDTASHNSQPAVSELPPPGFVRDIVETFGHDMQERIQKECKGNSSSGNPLPSSVRDLFPALSDLHTAVQYANNLRTYFGLSRLKIPTKKSRIQLVRVIARTRENLYSSIVAALLLPLAPVAAIHNGEEFTTDEEKPKISLTPTNLDILFKSLPQAFSKEKGLIKACLAENGGQAVYGETRGRVVWQGGVGRVVGAEGGFRGKLLDGDTHIFIDHSNILYGLLNCLYPSTSTSLPPRHLRTLSLPALSLLLRRGRVTPPGTLHLVASSPLKQNLDPLVRLGWEVSILKRVELFSDEVEDPLALNLSAKIMDRVPSGEGVGLRRYKEQGVDEILHLKLLQALNCKDDGRGNTIVLATGDAKGGQFNQDGFLGAVREALNRGWNVELWSFRAGLSRAWKEVGKREKWFDGGRFNVYIMDEWAEQLVEVSDDYEEGL